MNQRQRNVGLRIALVRSGLSSLEISRRAKITPTAISLYANGWRVPTGPIRKRIAKVLRVPEGDLWPEEAEKLAQTVLE